MKIENASERQKQNHLRLDLTAGKSVVLRGKPASRVWLESERAMVNSLDFPMESDPFSQRATLVCAHFTPQHLQHACTLSSLCVSFKGGVH